MKLKQHIEAQDLLYYSMLYAKQVECIDVTNLDDPEIVTYEEMYESPEAEIVGFETVDADTRKEPTVNSKRLLVIKFKRSLFGKVKPRPKFVKQIEFITETNVLGKYVKNWDDWFKDLNPCSNPRLVRFMRYYADEDGRRPAYIIHYSNDSFESAPYPEFCHSETFLKQSWQWIATHVDYDDRDELLPVLAAERDKLLQDDGINVNDVTLYDVLGVKTATAESVKTVLVEPDPAPEPDESELYDALGLSTRPLEPHYEFEKFPVNLRDIKITDSESLVLRATNAGYNYKKTPTVQLLNKNDLAVLKNAFLDGKPGYWTVGIHDEKLNASRIELPPEFEFERNDIEVI